MRLDTVMYKGKKEKPAVIFIHGLGMDKDIWVNPINSCILGGLYPLKNLLKKRQAVEDFDFTTVSSFKEPTPAEDIPGARRNNSLYTLFHDFSAKEYPIIAWSQQMPAGPMAKALKELKEIVEKAKKMTKNGIILVCHSRGGLIGRKYLLEKDKSIRGLVTISAPHKGTSIAKIAQYFSPLISLISPLFPAGDKGTVSYAVNRIQEFLKSRALKELLPNSNFFRTLRDGPLDGVYYISIGGTNPAIFTSRHFSIPDIFEKLIPDNLYPEELKKGKGDGLVSAESARLPWSDEHYNFDCNHAEILFEEEVRKKLVEAIVRIGC